MIEQQPVTVIDASRLPAFAAEKAKNGYRLIYVCATPGDPLEITYSFGRDREIAGCRIHVPRGPQQPVVPSITGSYFAALTYENELQDLFGIRVDGLALDFKGTFYRLAVKTPYAAAPGQRGSPDAGSSAERDAKGKTQ